MVIWCVVLMHGRYRVHGVSSPAEEVAFLKDLTPNLKLQIMIHKCKAVISNCPLFTTMPAMFRLELLNGLQHCVFMPGDYVCQIGSVAKVWQLRHAVLWWCPLIVAHAVMVVVLRTSTSSAKGKCLYVGPGLRVAVNAVHSPFHMLPGARQEQPPHCVVD